jgi:hypothetical protein
MHGAVLEAAGSGMSGEGVGTDAGAGGMAATEGAAAVAAAVERAEQVQKMRQPRHARPSRRAPSPPAAAQDQLLAARRVAVGGQAVAAAGSVRDQARRDDEQQLASGRPGSSVVRNSAPRTGSPPRNGKRPRLVVAVVLDEAGDGDALAVASAARVVCCAARGEARQHGWPRRGDARRRRCRCLPRSSLPRPPGPRAGGCGRRPAPRGRT